MKGNKKLLIIALLLLLITVSFTTYAIYKSKTSGVISLKAAKWSIKVEGDDIASKTLNFNYDDIVWNTPTKGKNNTIAPGDYGTISFDVDATGTEVDVELTTLIGVNANLPQGLSAKVISGTDGIQRIEYNKDSMKATITIKVTWIGNSQDSDTKIASDLSFNGSDIEIPITLVAKQAL